jgi:NitT/TauT family transport system substrate-binding protein
MKRGLCRGLFAAVTAVCLILSASVDAAPKKDFKIAWSIYVGWMPWAYAAESGIVKKWADKYGITQIWTGGGAWPEVWTGTSAAH